MCGSRWRSCCQGTRAAVRASASAKKRTVRRAATSGGRGDGPVELPLELLGAGGQNVQRGRAIWIEPERLDDLPRAAPFLGHEEAGVVRHAFDAAGARGRLVDDEPDLAGLVRMLVHALLDDHFADSSAPSGLSCSGNPSARTGPGCTES